MNEQGRNDATGEDSDAVQDAMEQLRKTDSGGEAGASNGPVGPNDGPAPAAGSQSGSPKGPSGGNVAPSKSS